MLTIDDLVSEYNKHCDNPYSPIDIRAGIIAVVTALRDEMASVTAWNAINEILAPGEGEYTGGMNDLNVSPAAPAPVCEWTPDTRTLNSHAPYCRPSETYVDKRFAQGDDCPLCGLPISFKTEAQR